jgi:hypothetical protein
MTRVSTSARRSLDTPLAEDSTGSRFERFVLTPYLVFAAAVALAAGVVTVVVLLTLR